MNDSGVCRSKLEQRLNAVRQKGKQEVVWNLTEEQAEFIKSELHLVVIPTLYEIQTKRIRQASNAMWLLQEIHRASKNGQTKIYKAIRKKELKFLSREDIPFRPVRYRIILDAT